MFGIKKRDRRQHFYVCGKTGTGKSELLKNMILQDINNGEGVGVVDPHGELVEDVMKKIPSSRINDVIYFNPSDSEYPVGFNVLEVPDPKYKHLVVSDLMSIFTKIWANVWSARMEYILQNCILALLDTPGTTLLGIPRILVDKNYRERIVRNIKDPVVRSFWVHEFESWRDQFRNEAIVPIQNKVGQFLNTPFIRNIVGQTKSSLNVQDVMNNGKILLVNVSKGRLGEDNAQLLGAMVVTKLQLAAMERVRIPEEERKDYFLYIDEFQNFATDSFANILSEARKYRLCLIVAHQYIGQLVTDTSTKVRDAIFGNVGTMLIFRVGSADAEALEAEFEPEFTIQDLVNLPNFNIYLKLMVNGITSRPFSATTLPPMRWGDNTDHSEKIIRVSREKYSADRKEVEDKIERWSSQLFEAEEEEGPKEKYKTRCWVCGKEITVGFKPDDRRPIYCPEHLKQVEAGEIPPVPSRKPIGGGGRVREAFNESLSGIGIEFEQGQRQQEKTAPNPNENRRPSNYVERRDFPPRERDFSRERPRNEPPRIPKVQDGNLVLKSDKQPSRSLPLDILKSRQPKRGPDLGALRELLKDSIKKEGEKNSGKERENKLTTPKAAPENKKEETKTGISLD